jgi:hypothetical protein
MNKPERAGKVPPGKRVQLRARAVMQPKFGVLSRNGATLVLVKTFPEEFDHFGSNTLWSFHNEKLDDSCQMACGTG